MAGSFYDRKSYYEGKKSMKDLHEEEKEKQKKAKVFKEKNDMPTSKPSRPSRPRGSRGRSLDTKKNISQKDKPKSKPKPTTDPTLKKIEEEVNKAQNQKSVTNQSGNDLTREQKQTKKRVETALMKRYSDYQTKVDDINETYQEEQKKKGIGLVKTFLGFAFGSPKIATSGLDQTTEESELSQYERDNFINEDTLDPMTVYTDDQADKIRAEQKKISSSSGGGTTSYSTGGSKVSDPDPAYTQDDYKDDLEKLLDDLNSDTSNSGYGESGGSYGSGDFQLASASEEDQSNNGKKLLGLGAVLVGGYLLYTYL